MDKLPKYATIIIDEGLFGQIVFKAIKNFIKEHGVSKNTIDFLQGLSKLFLVIHLQGFNLQNTQKIDSFIDSKFSKSSNAKLFVEDKFSKNNVSESKYAHLAIKNKYDEIIPALEYYLIACPKADEKSRIENSDSIAVKLQLLSDFFALSLAILTKKYTEALDIKDRLHPEQSEDISDDVLSFLSAQTEQNHS